jgi:hypothetical protein
MNNTPQTHEEMFKAACCRPNNYFDLSVDKQWEIDKELGILDWEGPQTDEELGILSEIFNVTMKR